MRNSKLELLIHLLWLLYLYQILSDGEHCLDTLFSLYFRLCLATDTSQVRLEIRQESLARHVPIYRIFQIDLMISQGYLLVIYFLAEG